MVRVMGKQKDAMDNSTEEDISEFSMPGYKEGKARIAALVRTLLECRRKHKEMELFPEENDSEEKDEE